MRTTHSVLLALLFVATSAVAPLAAQPAATTAPFTLQQVLAYPFPLDLTAAPDGSRIAWVINQKGVRNVWAAEAPTFAPRALTHFTRDDGQEITQLTFAPDGSVLVFVRGGDHDANWPAKTAPDPASSPTEPKVMLWAVSLPGGAAHAVTPGDAPAVSASGQLAYIRKHAVWTASLRPGSKPAAHRLFFDHGNDGDLRWSPDGKRLAFVSDRGDHAFIGVFTDADTPLLYLSPSASIDRGPRWSPDGSQIAFTRRSGHGGPPGALLAQTPRPWMIRVADARTGAGRSLWRSPDTLRGSYPQTAGGTNLHWAMHGKRLVFLANLDGWPHLYSIGALGAPQPLPLTPGNFMVEDVVMAPDGKSIVYSANTGDTQNDADRRHLFRVPADHAASQPLTSGTDIQTSPVAVGNAIAYVDAGAQRPPLVSLMQADGNGQRALQADLIPAGFPTAQLVVPQAVSFRAPDGTLVHGQLFRSRDAAAGQPGVVFVHGGPPRQMLLGWHYMDYYSNSYAVNQYLATHGFTVLSVNYRLSIGYGQAFHRPAYAGPKGASEYQDVVAGARYLQHVPEVDAGRIGIWGGSYGGYLTGLALARNSDIFKAGVAMHGLYDWSRAIGWWDGAKPGGRYERGDYTQAMQVAWEASPDAAIARWKSPVLLIQGDDDHNVHFAQMEDIVPRLRAHHIPFDAIVIPNEIHSFLRYASWLEADAATVRFLQRELAPTHATR